MIPSPADLNYFIEIANTGNISRAAERLGISQPSLSLSIRRLEEAVNANLFIRSKRGVVLTQAGKYLLAHSKELLQSWENICIGAQASLNEIKGFYTIGFHPSVARHSAAGFLPDLMQHNPDLNINLRHDLSRKITSEVIGMKCDIGIVVNPVPHPDLVIQHLCRDEVTLWTAATGRYSAQDIRSGNGILICDPDLIQTQALMKQMKKRKMHFARTLISTDLDVIADLTAHGAGIGVLPGQPALRAKLKPVVKAPVFSDEHCLIFRVENRNVKAIQAINQAIKRNFNS